MQASGGTLGAIWITPVTHSLCSGGHWECEDRPCPRRCTLEGGSFVTTFDARPYRFHGTCTYILVQVGHSLQWGPRHRRGDTVRALGPDLSHPSPRAPSSLTAARSWLCLTSLVTHTRRPPWSLSSTSPAR